MNAPEFHLDGKVILVTGAAGLIGREVCDAYAAYGARLALTDLHEQAALEAQAARLRDRYNDADVFALQADVTSDASVATLFEAVAGRFGRLDVLVNLAAIDAKFDEAGMGAIEASRFENFPLALWDASMQVNGTGLLRVTQAALRMMLPQKAGVIVNVASTYSLVAPNQDLYRYPDAGQQVFKPVDYIATKSMVPNFSRYLATLYARDGIRCNTIVPHGVDNHHPQVFKDNFARLSPLGRMCRVEELRGPFVFLASEASSYMTGSTLVVDGGWTAW